jgi:hypothetical protein
MSLPDAAAIGRLTARSVKTILGAIHQEVLAGNPRSLM